MYVEIRCKCHVTTLECNYDENDVMKHYLLPMNVVECLFSYILKFMMYTTTIVIASGIIDSLAVTLIISRGRLSAVAACQFSVTAT